MENWLHSGEGIAQSCLWLPHLCQNCHLCTKNEIFYTNLHTTVDQKAIGINTKQLRTFL